jgi:hypothetical protein
VAGVDLAARSIIVMSEGHGYEFLSKGMRPLEIMEGPLLPEAGIARADL